MPSMEDYEEIGETVGRLILKTKHPKLTFFLYYPIVEIESNCIINVNILLHCTEGYERVT